MQLCQPQQGFLRCRLKVLSNTLMHDFDITAVSFCFGLLRRLVGCSLVVDVCLDQGLKWDGMRQNAIDG